MCLTHLGVEGQVGGEVLREVDAALMTGVSQAGEDLPSLVATGKCCAITLGRKGRSTRLLVGSSSGMFETSKPAGECCLRRRSRYACRWVLALPGSRDHGAHLGGGGGGP